ncbi:hypothetical protein [Micromonospora sp. NBC_01796]|uniref:hypothetical protein n=1 Tax=Micromonospora sp. NBC_01796 TaxID=2975987 RepID=UPI002DDBCA8E|nr:hypothetical protein [Micromonospora sp. NBC_01796]WSA86532.1 hypothetical protein OIE47_02600 [Micromonospora sp. NBC_01796]
MRTRGATAVLATTLALTSAMVGCARADERRTTQPTPPTVATATASTPPRVPIEGSGAPAAPDGVAPANADAVGGASGPGGRSGQRGHDSPNPTAPPAPAPTAPVADDPSCALAVLLPATRVLVDDRSAGVTVDRVEVFGCRNAYARLIALPARSTDVIPSNQVFLHLVDATWRLVGRASAGLDCGDDGLPTEIATACAALSR